MTTTNLGLPVITGNMTADVVRDMNALANGIDGKAGVANGLATLGADGKVPANQLNVQTPADASTSVKGVVQLSSATNSTSETLAATAKAVKTAMDQANAAFTSASNGKTSIANAAGAPSVSSDTFTKIASDITTGKAGIATAIRAKGGTVNDTDSWGVMVNAIVNSANKRVATGEITSPAGTTNIPSYLGSNATPNYVAFDMSALPFVPSKITLRRTDKLGTIATVWHKDNYYYVSGTEYANCSHSSTAYRCPYTNGVVNIPVQSQSQSYTWEATE